MRKQIKRQDLSLGNLVVVTVHPETQVYTVAGFEGQNEVLLMWKEGKRICQQIHDIDSLYKPTIEQIEYSISGNGALVGTHEMWCKLMEKTPA